MGEWVPMLVEAMVSTARRASSSLAVALRRASYDYDEVFQRCIGVSNEWNYNPTSSSNLAERFSQKYMRQRSVPMTHKTLEEVLNPQPVAQKARS